MLPERLGGPLPSDAIATPNRRCAKYPERPRLRLVRRGSASCRDFCEWEVGYPEREGENGRPHLEVQPVPVVPKWKAHRAPLAGEQGEETPNFTYFVGSLYIIKLSARVSSAGAAWCGVCGNE